MGSRMARAGGRAAVGLQDLLSGQVLRRFVEQIIEHAKEEVFSLLPGLGVFSAVQQRFVEQNHVAQVRWRRSPT